MVVYENTELTASTTYIGSEVRERIRLMYIELRLSMNKQASDNKAKRLGQAYRRNIWIDIGAGGRKDLWAQERESYAC